MRARLAATGIVAALVLPLMAACSGSGGTHDPYIKPSKRTTAPALKGADLDGKQVNLASSRGRIAVVNFWASWCGPCRAESDGLRAAAQAWPNVSFLGVNVGDHRSNAQSFVRSHSLQYPSIFDDESEVATAWIVSALPQTFVVDAQGRVAARFPGAVTEQELNDMLHRVAADTSS